MYLVWESQHQFLPYYRYLWIPGSGMGEWLFSPELNPTAPRSEDPSGLLRIPQVLRRM